MQSGLRAGAVPQPWDTKPAYRELVYQEVSHSKDHRLTRSQSHRKDKLQSEPTRLTSIRDNQMARGKLKNLGNRNQDYLAL